MNNNDINILVTKWQSEMLSISKGLFSHEQAREILNSIIDEIVENREPIVNGELCVTNNISLFINIGFLGNKYDADIIKLSFLGI